MKKNIILILFIFLFFTTNLVFASEKIEFNGFVADSANLISPAVEEKINAFLWDLQRKTTSDVAVVTLNSLDGRSIEETALKIGRNMKVGAKGKNNGAVILVAPNERKMRIEIGYGLEGAITDAHAGRIRDNDMLPYFSRGDYENGILRGSYTLASDIAKSYGTTINSDETIPPPLSSESDYTLFILVLIVIISLSIRGGFFPLFLGGGYSGSGFSSGGFGGFGDGGGFGGGGASGGW